MSEKYGIFPNFLSLVNIVNSMQKNFKYGQSKAKLSLHNRVTIKQQLFAPMNSFQRFTVVTSFLVW